MAAHCVKTWVPGHERFPDKSISGVPAMRMRATFTVKKIDGTFETASGATPRAVSVKLVSNTLYFRGVFGSLRLGSALE